MNKKVLAIIGAVLLLVVVGGVFAFQNFLGKNNQTDEAGKKKTVLENYNEIPVPERPYLRLSPTTDGRYVELSAVEVKKSADNMEYELEYQSGTLLQGVFGNLSLSSLPASTKQLLGSCSAGGSCTYHEDVTGGKLTTRYDGKNPYALRQEWRYIENTDGETTLASRDAKFQLISEDLADTLYAIILNSPGYPGEPKGTVVSDPYAVSIPANAPETATVSIRANEAGNLVILGWNGSEWEDLKTTVEDKTATATDAPISEVYLVVTR